MTDEPWGGGGGGGPAAQRQRLNYVGRVRLTLEHFLAPHLFAGGCLLLFCRSSDVATVVCVCVWCGGGGVWVSEYVC